MSKKTIVKASPEPSIPRSPDGHDAANNVDQRAGNATKPLQKRRVRANAQADQATLQEKGPNALPVSDYPLKKGPVAANSLDQAEQARSRTTVK